MGKKVESSSSESKVVRIGVAGRKMFSSQPEKKSIVMRGGMNYPNQAAHSNFGPKNVSKYRF